MKFRDYFSLKHILFAIFLIAIMIPFAIHHSNTLVQVELGEEDVYVTSSKYTVRIRYDEIASAELIAFVEDGNEKVSNTFNDDLLRTGVWKNDTWGEYIICAYLETGKCIKLELTDGSTVIISHKSEKATTETFNTIVSHLPQ